MFILLKGKFCILLYTAEVPDRLGLSTADLHVSHGPEFEHRGPGTKELDGIPKHPLEGSVFACFFTILYTTMQKTVITTKETSISCVYMLRPGTILAAFGLELSLHHQRLDVGHMLAHPPGPGSVTFAGNYTT